MRRFLFRFSATLLGVLFIGAFAVGGFNNMLPFERAMTVAMGIVFLLYGLVGERAADFVLASLFGATVPPASQDQAAQNHADDDDVSTGERSCSENRPEP